MASRNGIMHLLFFPSSPFFDFFLPLLPLFPCPLFLWSAFLWLHKGDNCKMLSRDSSVALFPPHCAACVLAPRRAAPSERAAAVEGPQEGPWRPCGESSGSPFTGRAHTTRCQERAWHLHFCLQQAQRGRTGLPRQLSVTWRTQCSSPGPQLGLFFLKKPKQPQTKHPSQKATSQALTSLCLRTATLFSRKTFEVFGAKLPFRWKFEGALPGMCRN